jgi:alpha-N-acetylglucosaminidase
MSGRRDMDMRTFDAQIREWEWKWVHAHDTYPTEAKGDPVETAKALYAKYRKQIAALYHS